MKKLLLILVAVLLFASPLWAADEEKIQINSCPKTTMQRDCLLCHVAGDFRVRETAHDAHLRYPNSETKIHDGVGYFFLTEIDSPKIRDFFDYLSKHDIKKAVVEIHSYGGALFDAQRIVSMVREFQAKGGKVETRIYGMAFSAGFYVFVSGDKRIVDPDADLMWHELLSFEGFGVKITTPSDREEAARILRHLQDVRNKYLSTRGKLSKEEIDRLIAKKEWWMTGKQAVELGFADGFIK